MNPATILDFLTRASNQSLPLNGLMHVLVLAAVISLFIKAGSRTKRLVFDVTLLILFSSVAAMSLLVGNPFNFGTFAILAFTAAIEVFRGKNQVDTPKNDFNTYLAFAFILTGFVYPEFTRTSPWLLPFVSPVGIVPCPTLLVTMGMLNLILPGASKLQYMVTTVIGTIYAVIGVFVLRVYLDVTLLALVGYSLYNFRFFFGRKRELAMAAR